jgi:hypothetical protein
MRSRIPLFPSSPSVALFLPLSVLLTGCVMLQPLKKREPDTALTRNTAGIGFKQVTDKREPAYLVAMDGTECTVSRGAFQKARVGESVFCAWR